MGALWNAIPGSELVKSLVALAAFLAAGGRMYAKQIRPLMQAILRIDRSVPVLLGIADEFSPNGGKSLHDRLVRTDEATAAIASKLADVVDVTENIESTLEAQDRMVIRLLVAVAHVGQKVGVDVLVDLPAHIEETNKEL